MSDLFTGTLGPGRSSTHPSRVKARADRQQRRIDNDLAGGHPELVLGELRRLSGDDARQLIELLGFYLLEDRCRRDQLEAALELLALEQEPPEPLLESWRQAALEGICRGLEGLPPRTNLLELLLCAEAARDRALTDILSQLVGQDLATQLGRLSGQEVDQPPPSAWASELATAALACSNKYASASEEAADELKLFACQLIKRLPQS